ncbi:MAG: dipicolinate synthase subunit B [Clostridiaceae bacterium]|jgi:dipicolinate synthase subunit B|nr:dipicolinate synthase subunit B [Clostridiaceae bacterium]
MGVNGKKIGIAVTGSFCTIGEAMVEFERLVFLGADITPIISNNVATIDSRFGRAEEIRNSLELISGKKCIDSISDAEPIGPERLLDLVLVAPCTGNTLGKIAGGITDTPVTMAVKAHLRNQMPVVLAIATNDGLSGSARNIGSLINTKNIYFVPFGQDDAIKKPTSLVAKFKLIVPTIEHALDGKQIEPVLV